MDRADFAVKFSGELLVLALGVLVAALNVNFLWGDASRNFNDKSLAAKLLSYHPDQNRRLNTKNNSIVTTVAKHSQLFAQALADEEEGLSSEDAQEPAENFDDPAINEDALSKPNPDSVEAMLAKQIKVYQTQTGDTLASIAKASGISTQTLIWANRLSSEKIKPGWFLVILPVDGVLHKADPNDTIPDIAKKYRADIGTILSYNLLENEEDIEPGQLFIVPEGRMPEPPKPKKPKKSQIARGGKVRAGGKIQDVPQEFLAEGGEHLFPKGYCTWYVAKKVAIPWGGNAKNWLKNAQAYGAIITKTPAVGTLVVTTDNRRYGHVAYVEQVETDRFLVSEMNYQKFGQVNFRWIDSNSGRIRGFIHP